MTPTSSIKITYPSDSVAQDSGIGPLPIDVVVHTLSYLNFNELQECVVLSKTMKSITIESAKYNKVEELKYLIQKLMALLDECALQISDHENTKADRISTLRSVQSSLKAIHSSLKVSEFSNLFSIENYVFQIKDQLIELLKSLDLFDLNRFSELLIQKNEPKFAVKLASSIEAILVRPLVFCTIFSESLKRVGVEQALFVVHFADDPWKNFMLEKIIARLVKKKDFDRACQIATSLTSLNRDNYLEAIQEAKKGKDIPHWITE